MTRPCIRCRSAERAGAKKRWCRRCAADYMRAYRATHKKKLSRLARLRTNVGRAIRVLIERGKIDRLPCAVCGAPSSRLRVWKVAYPPDAEYDFFCLEHWKGAKPVSRETK